MQVIVKDGIRRLPEVVLKLKDNPVDYKAIHFRFSELLEHYRSEYQTKIALNIINDILRNRQGYVIRTEDEDIFVIGLGIDEKTLNKLIFQLRYLMMDDPLAYTGDGAENPEFAASYDVNAEWQQFFAVCRSKSTNPAQQKTAQPKAQPFTPARLSQLEIDLAQANLSETIRKQAICAIVAGKEARTIFHELYVNIGHLKTYFKMDYDPASNKSLFKYLTHLLDRKLLDLLQEKRDEYLEHGGISINLNTDTVLSSKFADFDKNISGIPKSRIVIELNIADIFSDIAAFSAARGYLSKQGYKVCLDGLTNLSFIQVDRESLGFDLAKLQWAADLENDISRNAKLLEYIKKCGASRLILSRCDTAEAVKYGHALGISLFQGRFLDQRINPDAKVVN